jgi:phage terminase Nu1 subunit (DNA packaging protein)
LTNWQAAGMPVRLAGARGEGNEYDTVAVVRWLLNRKEGKREKSARDVVAEHQARLLELQIAEKTGELVPQSEIRPAWVDLITSAKQALRSLPARVAPLLAQADNADAMRDVLDNAIEDVLSKLAADDEDEEAEQGDARADARGARALGATVPRAAVGVGRTLPAAAGRIADTGSLPVRDYAVPARDR